MKHNDMLEYELKRSLLTKRLKTQFDIELRDYLLLIKLSNLEKDPIRLTEFKRHMSFYKGNLSQSLKKLCTLGYFSKKRDCNDERSMIIYDINYSKIAIVKKHIDSFL